MMDPDSNSPLVKRFGTCTKDCYGSCVYEGFWDDKNPVSPLIKAQPLKSHPFTQGVFCPKFTKRETLLYHPNRLTTPLRLMDEKPSQFHVPVSVDQAWQLLTEKLNAVVRDHGKKSVLGAYYSGNQGQLSMGAVQRFMGALGGKITTGGICNEGGCAALEKIFGTYALGNPFLLSSPDTKMVVVWGSNITTNNNHAYLLLQKALKRGTKLVVIDPIKTEIAKKANLFIQPTPNCFQFVCLAVIQELKKRNIINIKFLQKSAIDWENFLLACCSQADGNWIDQIGVSNAAISRFVDYLDEFQGHTVFSIGYGTQKDYYGGFMVQMIASIQVLLGNLGLPGAGIIYSQSAHTRQETRTVHEIIVKSNFIPTCETVETISLVEALENPDTKFLFITNFNPLSSLPNQGRLRKALSRADLFVVVLEVFPTETSQWADLIFPMKYDAETDELVMGYYVPSISINQAGPCPYSACLSNHAFFNKLGQIMGEKLDWSSLLRECFQEDEKTVVQECLQALGKVVKNNVLNNGYHLFLKPSEVLHELGSFPTSTRKIDLNEIQLSPAHLAFRPLTSRLQFYLLTPNHARFLHSQLLELNSQFQVDFEKVFINPEILRELKWKEGDRIQVKNEFGVGIFSAALDYGLSYNEVVIFSGGPNRTAKKPNANFFTPDCPEEIGGSGVYNSAIVTLEKIN